MIHSFLFDLDAIYLIVILFFSMLAAIWIGYKTGLKKNQNG